MLFRRERCKATASAKAFKRIGCRRLLRLVAVLQTFLQSVHAMIELSDLDHFAKVPTRAESSPASAGVNSPSATALTMAAIAVTASPAVDSVGRRKRAGLSRRGGIIRSRHRRNACYRRLTHVLLPCGLILRTGLRVAAPASMVGCCRVPLGFPAGLPDCPGFKRPAAPP